MAIRALFSAAMLAVLTGSALEPKATIFQKRPELRNSNGADAFA